MFSQQQKQYTQAQQDNSLASLPVSQQCSSANWLPLHTFMTTKSLSVVMPAFNEEIVIAETLLSTISVLEALVPDFEVLVVNDGSSDKTGVIAGQVAAIDERVRVIHHPENRGYGAALVSGFEAATKELTFFMDADGQFDIHNLAQFLPLIEQYDAVLGYRLQRQDSWLRKLNAWGWKMLVGLVFGVHVRDVDCAFKLYKGDFFRKHHLETRGAMINTEMLYKFTREGHSYIEVGVQHQQRRGGQATGAKPAVIWQAFRELFHYANQWHRLEYLQSQHNMQEMRMLEKGQ